MTQIRLYTEHSHKYVWARTIHAHAPCLTSTQHEKSVNKCIPSQYLMRQARLRRAGLGQRCLRNHSAFLPLVFQHAAAVRMGAARLAPGLSGRLLRSYRGERRKWGTGLGRASRKRRQRRSLCARRSRRLGALSGWMLGARCGGSGRGRHCWRALCGAGPAVQSGLGFGDRLERVADINTLHEHSALHA